MVLVNRIFRGEFVYISLPLTLQNEFGNFFIPPFARKVPLAFSLFSKYFHDKTRHWASVYFGRAQNNI